MKLATPLLLLSFLVGAHPFIVVPGQPGWQLSPITTTSSSSTSSTTLFDSRHKQKKATRGAWLERRGIDGGNAATATTSSSDSAMTAGLMTNTDGLEYVQLVHPDTGATAQIYLYGAVVTSYCDSPNGGIDYIAIRPDAKMDGSKPISGGLSHCWPQFGPGLIQQHGFARNVVWTITSQSDTAVTMELSPSDYTKAIWDKDFVCRFTTELHTTHLQTTMMVENTGTESFDFQAALHSYFAVSSLDNLQITGSFAGKEFLNKLAGSSGAGEMQMEDRDIITITEEYDRVYKGVNDPVLKDTGTGKTLTIRNEVGWEDTVIWNPYGNEGMGYNNFVCVESVKFDPVTLEGGGSWEAVLALEPGTL